MNSNSSIGVDFSVVQARSMWDSSAYGGNESGMGIPILNGGGVSEGGCTPPQKIFVFSPSKWCILMHSEANFTPTVIIDVYDINSNILKLHMLNSAAKR